MRPMASDSAIIGPVDSDSLESIEKRLLSNRRTKVVFKSWLVPNSAGSIIFKTSTDSQFRTLVRS